MMQKTIRVATRKSKLALVQTENAILALSQVAPDIKFEIVKIVTEGDVRVTEDLSKIGGKGLFLKEIEAALLRNEADIAMHSLKDVPTVLEDNLIIGAYLMRDDPRDCMVSKHQSLKALPINATVGTSSLRRKFQLLAIRPDLNIVFTRGNVDTRISKVENGELDAVILAYAGLIRLGRASDAKEIFDIEVMVPSPGQGIVCLECRSKDFEAFSLLQLVNDKESQEAAEIERKYMKDMGGNCTTPIGAYYKMGILHTFYKDMAKLI
jgi:hydroxymethylbilane synthase